MPHKSRKSKGKVEKPKQEEKGESATSKQVSSADVLDSQELEHVASIIGHRSLSDAPLVVLLTILRKKKALLSLLKQGQNVNEYGPHRTTAVMWAVKCKHIPMVRLLLSNGADPWLKDDNGNHVLFLALEDVMWEENKFFSLWCCTRNVGTFDVDLKNKSGVALLHLAVKREWTKAVNAILQKKADINITTSSGATPLMLASFRHNRSVTETLLGANADVLCRDSRGRTALCYAISTSIAKGLTPPFPIVDLIVKEMESKGCSFKDYLVKCVIDCSFTDTVNCETLNNIIVFTIRHVPNGTKMLLEIRLFETLLKTFLSLNDEASKEKMLLNIIAEVLSHDDHPEIADKFFTTLWAPACLHTFKKYSSCQRDDAVVLRAASIYPLMLTAGNTEGSLTFLKNNLGDILEHYDRSLENHLLQKVEASEERRTFVHNKIQFFKAQLQLLKTDHTVPWNRAFFEKTDTPDDELVSAIKVGVERLREDLDKPEEIKDFRYQRNSVSKASDVSYRKSGVVSPKYMDDQTLDSILNYFTEVFEKIVRTCENRWDVERKAKGNAREDIHDEESEAIQRLQEQFKSLVTTLKRHAHRNRAACQVAIADLEDLLFKHRIKGNTVTAETATSKYFDQTNSQDYFEETGDQLYYKEMSLLSEKKLPDPKLEQQAHDKTMEHKYHLIPSIMSVCESDEDEEKTYEQNVPKTSLLDLSRYRSAFEDLKTAPDYELLLGGDIKASSKEKRAKYIISAIGSFNTVEVALDVYNRPLAVKRVSETDKVSKTLKLLVGPLLRLRNTNILHYFACDFEDDELILATPLCEYNIGEYLHASQNSRVPVFSSGVLVGQFLDGLRFLHEHKEPVVHGNLKPSNIFVDLRGVVRVAEFGIYRALFQLHEAPASSTIWFATETYETFKKTAALECTRASDIQVSGMLVHFILTGGKHPYGDDAGEILSNLEKSNTQIATCDVDLHDLIAWMLLPDPKDRPTIGQVSSHVFFWSSEKRWRFILTCAGAEASCSTLNVEELHVTIDSSAKKDDIKGSWVAVVKQAFPKLSCIDDNDDTPTGLLRFIKSCCDNKTSVEISADELCRYILGAFPALTLFLYRMLESTSWLKHPAFLPFIK